MDSLDLFLNKIIEHARAEKSVDNQTNPVTWSDLYRIAQETKREIQEKTEITQG